jgi:hypothetical protein
MTKDPNPHINAARLEIDKLRESLSEKNVTLTHDDLEYLMLKINKHLSIAQAIIADQRTHK